MRPSRSGTLRRTLAALFLVAACTRGAPDPQLPARQPGAAVLPPVVAPTPAAATAPARVPAETMSWRGADWLTRPEREAEERPEQMLDLLQVPVGGTVADIGAGVGYHAWRLARRVGARGRVYATDLQPEMLRLLEASMKEHGVTNVVTIQSGQDRTGLPDGAIDLALMVDVYHELSDARTFLAAVRRALKPAGRLALVEFRAEDPAVPIRIEHKMTAEQVVAELHDAGFSLVMRDESLPWQHVLLFRVER